MPNTKIINSIKIDSSFYGKPLKIDENGNLTYYEISVPKFVDITDENTDILFTTTKTFNLADMFIDGSQNNQSNLIALHVRFAMGAAYKSNNLGEWTFTFPNGTKTAYKFRSFGQSQGAIRQSSNVVYLPVDPSTQTSITFTLIGGYGALQEFELIGATILKPI